MLQWRKTNIKHKMTETLGPSQIYEGLKPLHKSIASLQNFFQKKLNIFFVEADIYEEEKFQNAEPFIINMLQEFESAEGETVEQVDLRSLKMNDELVLQYEGGEILNLEVAFVYSSTNELRFHNELRKIPMDQIPFLKQGDNFGKKIEFIKLLRKDPSSKKVDNKPFAFSKSNNNAAFH
jgi:hypothetical protein